jgi:cytochrome-b5 reductase
MSITFEPTTTKQLPSSLTSPPTLALVPPGQLCQFGVDAVAVPLLERTAVSPTTYVLRFGPLPDPSQPLNLSTCACILATATIDGESITRPYTPISTNAQIGHFDLLVKDYGPNSHMSHYLCQTLQPGKDSISDCVVNFKHIPPNVKIQAPFDYDHIVMLVGGTGTFLYS